MSSNKTDSYFRDRLAGFEQSPPESTWENIARKLGERRKRSVFLLVFRIAAGMAILLSTGIGVYLVTRENSGKMKPALSENIRKNNNSENNAKPSSSKSEYAVTNKPVSVPQQATSEKPAIIREQKTGVINKEADLNKTEPGLISQDEPGNPIQYETGVINQNSFSYAEVNLPGRLTGLKGRPVYSKEMPVMEAREMSAEEATAMLLADYYKDTDAEKKANSRWSLGSEVAPLYSYRAITSDDLQQASIKQFNESESGVLAYAGGIRVNYSTGGRLTVQSGIYYSRYGQQKEAQTVSGNSSEQNYSFVQVTNSTGRIRGVVDNKMSFYSASPNVDPVIENFTNTRYKNGISNADMYPVVPGDASDIRFEQLFDYFELPLIVKYKIIDRRMDFSFNGGLVTNFLFGNSINMINDGKTTRITETTEINKVNYLGSFGLGFDYPLSHRFDITIEPRFRYYINPIGTESEIIVHPFSFGFFAGFNYRF